MKSTVVHLEPSAVADATAEIGADTISNRRFAQQLEQLRGLKRFLFKENVSFKPEDLGALDLGTLNNLQYSTSGRSPNAAEWRALDEKMAAMTAYLDDDLRRKIKIQELSFFFGPLPLTLLFVVTAATIAYALYPGFLRRDTTLWFTAFFVTMAVWTIAQGALGACAYLGTRVATRPSQKMPDDDIADVTDINVVKVRIILGALFALIIGLPLALQSLNAITGFLFDSGTKPAVADFAFILAPFLFGFSTNLVLAILNRCVISLQTLFGLGARKR